MNRVTSHACNRAVHELAQPLSNALFKNEKPSESKPAMNKSLLFFPPPSCWRASPLPPMTGAMGRNDPGRICIRLGKPLPAEYNPPGIIAAPLRPVIGGRGEARQHEGGGKKSKDLFMAGLIR